MPEIKRVAGVADSPMVFIYVDRHSWVIWLYAFLFKKTDAKGGDYQ
jgi:hypothetical protein